MREIYSPDALWLHRQIYFFVALFILLILLFSLTAESSGQEKYPNRPITIVAPFPPGGVADLTARPVAAAMEKVLKNPVVVVEQDRSGGRGGDVVRRQQQARRLQSPDGAFQHLDHSRGGQALRPQARVHHGPAHSDRVDFR